MLAGGAMALSACKKAPGENSREQVEQAGYEMTREAFFRAAESDDIKAMESMLDGGMALDGTDDAGRTVLHAAAGRGAQQAIDFLLLRGLYLDTPDKQGRTPLMEAVVRSTPETVRYLLRRGADPRARDAEKYKPLMLAVKEGRRELVAELAPYVREDLDDALLAASILGQPGVIDELTNYGASIYARLEDGRTPLMLAAEHGQSDAAEMLLSIGANRLAMDSTGRTAAELAREAGHVDLAARLDGAPQEGDFELQEPAELAAELLEGVEQPMAEAGNEAADAETGEAGADPVGTEIVETSEVVELEGAVVGGGPAVPEAGPVASTAAGDQEDDDEAGADGVKPAPALPVVMKTYRQRELPLRVESTTPDAAVVQVVGGTTHEVAVGEKLPDSNLKVVDIRRKMQSGKEAGGAPLEVSVVEVEDGSTGIRRELVVGLPALAHDPVALVQDATTGRFYVARTGQRFRSSDGEDYLVGDVRPNQVVFENLQTGETLTVPLSGPRG